MKKELQVVYHNLFSNINVYASKHKTETQNYHLVDKKLIFRGKEHICIYINNLLTHWKGDLDECYLIEKWLFI